MTFSGVDNPPLTLPDPDLPEIAVGILSYNRADQVLRTLEILASADYPLEKLHLVVIDNASSDSTADRVRERFGDRVEVMTLARNIGAVARNHVLMWRSEPYLFHFDDDCAPLDRRALRTAVEQMEANRDIGALCFHSVNLHSGRTEFGDLGVISRRRLANGTYEGVFVLGGGMCFRREDIQRTSGYDERVFWGGEELQLGLELLHQGIRMVYDPSLVLVHRRAPREFSRAQQLEFDTRNNVMVVFTFYPFLLAAPVAFAFTARRYLTAVLKRKSEERTAVLRGCRRALKQLPNVLATRRTIPISRLAEHNRWFFGTFVPLKPTRQVTFDPEYLKQQSLNHAPAVGGEDTSLLS